MEQVEKLLLDHTQNGNLRRGTRLKTALRQCLTRLTLEGVQSILSSPCLGHNFKLRSHTWGGVSLADVLLLLDVKYNVVKQLLFTEMLQEHYTQSLWERMLPWEQNKEKEELEDLAMEALEAGNILHLASLPGAFRIYRVNLGAKFREDSWSAVSLLYDIYIYRQQERDMLTVLGECLNRESLKVVCLHIMVAALKVCREKVSYSAFLAARQSWETWPQVSSTGQEKLASFWLYSEDEHSENLIQVSLEQAELQRLAITQELEKRQLVKLLQEISLDNLHGQELTMSLKNETALRSGCIKKLRQIRSGLLRGTLVEDNHGETEQHSQLQIPTSMLREGVMMPQHILQEFSMHLLNELQQIHDVKAFSLLQQLMYKNKKQSQIMDSENESKLLMEVKTYLFQVLGTDDHLNPAQQQTMSSGNGTDEIQSSVSGPALNLSVASEKQTDGEIYVQTSTDVTAQLQVCKDRGTDMEEMPYLEISCFPDSTSEIHQTSSVEGHGTQKKGEEGNSVKEFQIYEKQGSLITFAWSKPPNKDEDHAEKTAIVIEQSQDMGSCLRAGIEPHQQEKSQNNCKDLFNSSLEKCELTGLLEAQPTSLVLKEQAIEPISELVREKTIQNLVDKQRKVEHKQQREKERQLLRVQERLSIMQSRKAKEELLGLKVTDLLRQLNRDLPQEDKTQQKTVIKERVDQLRRECSYVLQSKRERNTAGFMELLHPVDRIQEQDDKGD